jgi:phospholipid/cholesterol/gamma-HCH transport system substrate-binding protein
VELTVWLTGDTKVPVDSSAWVNTLGLLGEKYIEIIPGTNYTEFLKEGDALVGDDPISMQEITNLGRKIALKLDDSINHVNDVIKDETTKENLKETIDNLKYLTGTLRSIMERIETGQGTIGRLIYDDKIADDLEGFVEDLKKNPWKLLHKPNRK